MKDTITLSNLDLQISQIIQELVEGSDDLFKCLKYPSRDALSKSITLQDKLDLLDDRGSENARLYRYAYAGNQVEGKAQTQIRIYDRTITPINIYNSQVQIAFDVLMHHTLVQMDDRKTRTNVIFSEITNVLGKDRIIIANDASGGTSFQMKFGSGDRKVTRYFNDEYYGYTFTMTFEAK